MYVTTQRLASIVWWSRLRRQVREFVTNHSTCQRFKQKNAAYQGKLQPLPVPKGVITDVTMDFIEGLHKFKGKTLIMVVVVDHLIKYGNI